MSDADIKTPELLEEERKQKHAHALRISDITLKIEEILIAENVSWSDWADILETFNARSQMVMGSLKIKSIKEMYERPLE